MLRVNFSKPLFCFCFVVRRNKRKNKIKLLEAWICIYSSCSVIMSIWASISRRFLMKFIGRARSVDSSQDFHSTPSRSLVWLKSFFFFFLCASCYSGAVWLKFTMFADAHLPWFSITTVKNILHKHIGFPTVRDILTTTVHKNLYFCLQQRTKK